MPRKARIVVPGTPHHVIQRGNRRQNVFFHGKDKNIYLKILKENIAKYSMEIWAYCLMDNHIHLIAVPHRAEYLSKAIGETHKAYTWIINRREGWKGYLWEGRFKSFPMDHDHVYKAVRYIELNPVRAHLVRRPEDYRWSSAWAHIYGKKKDILTNFHLINEIKDWRRYLAQKDEEEIKQIRRQITTGLPWGKEDFVKNLEKKWGRILRRRKPGPKAKN